MTLPAAPLPTVRSVLRAWASRDSASPDWAGGEEVARRYSRGAFALAAGVEAVRKAAGASRGVLWIPGYFCNEALVPTRRLPVEVRLYPIREDLAPDWGVLEHLASPDVRPQVFMLVHYFGFPNGAPAAQDFCRRRGMILLEDCAHVLAPGAMREAGELRVYSPRKLLAVPSGAVLVVAKRFAAHLEAPLGCTDRKDRAKWLARRFAQRLLVRLHLPWHHFRRLRQVTDVAGTVNSAPLSAAPDPFAFRLLAALHEQEAEVVARRRQAYSQLLECTSNLRHVRPLFPFLPAGTCPYAFPVLLEHGCEPVVARLQARGIPASRWPDLPPEVTARPGEHQVAVRVYEWLMLLPLHQSLAPRHIDRIGKELVRAVSSA